MKGMYLTFYSTLPLGQAHYLGESLKILTCGLDGIKLSKTPLLLLSSSSEYGRFTTAGRKAWRRCPRDMCMAPTLFYFRPFCLLSLLIARLTRVEKINDNYAIQDTRYMIHDTCKISFSLKLHCLVFYPCRWLMHVLMQPYHIPSLAFPGSETL